MNERGKRGAEQRTGKAERDRHVLQIGFSHSGGMLGKELAHGADSEGGGSWKSRNLLEKFIGHDAQSVCQIIAKMPYSENNLLLVSLFMENIAFDAFDKRILEALQEDASISLAELAASAKLSPTPTWRRVQRLETAGVIRRRVALLDASKINLGVTVFVGVKTNQHNQAWLDRFAAAVIGVPEIVEVYRMSGDLDYLLRVVVPDIAGYDAVYRRLISSIELSDVSSSFAMEQLKFTTSLPLDYV